MTGIVTCRDGRQRFAAPLRNNFIALPLGIYHT